MRLTYVSMVALLTMLLGCEQQTFTHEISKKTASTEEAAKPEDNSSNVEAADVEDDAAEDDNVEQVEAPPVVQPFSQADILAGDNVVIVAMADSGTTAKYFSDVGRTAATTQALLAGAGYQLGTELTAAAPLQVKPGQTMIFCNHPQSVQTFRAHGGGGNAPFDHWPNDKVLQAGECFEANGDVIVNNVNNNPGAGFYNHNQGNGNADTTAIFVSIIDAAAAQAVIDAQ